jgi:hypothetical protein
VDTVSVGADVDVVMEVAAEVFTEERGVKVARVLALSHRTTTACSETTSLDELALTMRVDGDDDEDEVEGKDDGDGGDAEDDNDEWDEEEVDESADDDGAWDVCDNVEDLKVTGAFGAVTVTMFVAGVAVDVMRVAAELFSEERGVKVARVLASESTRRRSETA